MLERKYEEKTETKGAPQEDKDPFPPVLSDMSFTVNPGDLVMICGEVGSGKSSLLLTIANETIKTSGSIMVRGRLSLATQTAFVFSNTLQKNITFGNPLDRHRYRKVIRACALDSDLENIVGGDQVELGAAAAVRAGAVTLENMRPNPRNGWASWCSTKS